MAARRRSDSAAPERAGARAHWPSLKSRAKFNGSLDVGIQASTRGPRQGRVVEGHPLGDPLAQCSSNC